MYGATNTRTIRRAAGSGDEVVMAEGDIYRIVEEVNQNSNVQISLTFCYLARSL